MARENSSFRSIGGQKTMHWQFDRLQRRARGFPADVSRWMLAPPSISEYTKRRISRGSFVMNADCRWSDVTWFFSGSIRGSVSARGRGGGLTGRGGCTSSQRCTHDPLCCLGWKQSAHKKQGPQHAQKIHLHELQAAFLMRSPVLFPALLSRLFGIDMFRRDGRQVRQKR
jgi:hypothetical protein